MPAAVLYDVLENLLPEGALAVPVRRQSDGMWDWYYQLGSSDRKRVLRHCAPGGLQPDECARAAGFDYVDEWAQQLVAAITAKKQQWDAVSEYPDRMPLAPDALMGPVEVAEYCQVKVDTVYQWVTRGRLPEPWAVLSGTRLWPAHVIEEWAAETGRLGKTVDLPF